MLGTGARVSARANANTRPVRVFFFCKWDPQLCNSPQVPLTSLYGLPEHLVHLPTTAPVLVRVLLQVSQLAKSLTEHVCSSERATPNALGASSGSTAAARHTWVFWWEGGGSLGG